jgi:hypothetical protein
MRESVLCSSAVELVLDITSFDTCNIAFDVEQRLEMSILVSFDVSFEEVRQSLLRIVFDEDRSRARESCIEFFECELLGFLCVEKWSV